MEQYFISNDILEAPVFPLTIGTKAYELLHSLIAPDSPKDKWFNDLVKRLCVHLKPKPFDLSFIRECNKTECGIVHCNLKIFHNIL